MKRTQQVPVFNDGNFVGVASFEYDDNTDAILNSIDGRINSLEYDLGRRLEYIIQSFNQRLEEAGGVPFDEEELKQFLSSH